MNLAQPIEFQWDKGNIDKNLVRHRVGKEEIEEVFSDAKKKLSTDQLHSNSEDRFILLGKTVSGRLLFIAFTLRGNKVRVISARDLSRKDRIFYYEKRTKTTKI